MTDRLHGKVVIVTGGTRGMGEAIVRGIAAEGGRVVFGGRDESAGQAITSDIGEAALYVRQDVAVEGDWQAIVLAATARFKRIDGLVNNAGMLLAGPLEQISLDQAQQVILTNQIAILMGMKHVVGPMRSVGGGSIVNIGSIAVRRGMPGIVHYSGTKAAVSGMSRSAAAEFAHDNIRVNVVHPGPFETQMMQQARGDNEPATEAKLPPLGRIAQPPEIVGAVIYLLSDESGFVTGAEIDVNGGVAL